MGFKLPQNSLDSFNMGFAILLEQYIIGAMFDDCNNNYKNNRILIHVILAEMWLKTLALKKKKKKK